MGKLIYILTIVFNCSLFCGISQNKEEFEVHLTSIDSTFSSGYERGNLDSVFNNNRRFIDYVIENVIEEEKDKYFISNRNILKKFQVQSCNDNEVIFKDTLKDGNSCEIKLLVKTLDLKDHKIVYTSDSSRIKSINNIEPLGSLYGSEMEDMMISDLSIEIEGKQLNIPEKSYLPYLNPIMCNPSDYFERPIEVYSSLNGKYIYIYIYGGMNAYSYFTKLIFNKEKYITSITVDYIDLSVTGSFRKDFIGF